MTETIRPQSEVPAPVTTSPRFGLLSVVAFPAEADDHWLGGAWFQSALCGGGGHSRLGDICAPAAGPVFAPGASGIGYSETSPITVWDSVDCQPVGFTMDQMQALARERLAATEERSLEAAFWSGADSFADAEWGGGLAGATALPPVDSIEAGIGALEKYAGLHYGGTPVIHASRDVAAQVPNTLRVAGTHMETVLGSYVAFGTGYPGTGPAAEAGLWLYVTGALAALRTEVEDMPPTGPAGFDRETNRVRLTAQRSYLIMQDCMPPACVHVTS